MDALALKPTLAETEDLESQITELAAHIHAAIYRLLTLIAEFDRREAWAEQGMGSCAHWLNWKCGTGLGAGREKVRVAKALQSLPQIGEAFSKGRISYSKVRAMTRIANPKNEADLRNVAFHGTAAHVEKLVRGYRRVRQADELEAANARHAKRALHWYYDDDGSTVIHCRLDPEDDARVIQAIPAAGTFPRERLNGCTQLIAENQNQKLDIDADTCIPHWEGETMDYGMALDGLLAADGVLVKNYAAWEAEV